MTAAGPGRRALLAKLTLKKKFLSSDGSTETFRCHRCMSTNLACPGGVKYLRRRSEELGLRARLRLVLVG